MFRSLLAVLALSLISACVSHSIQNAYQGEQGNTGLVTSANTLLINYVDNDEVSEGFVGQEITYRVDAGQRTLLLQYSDLFSIGSDDHEKVVSRPAKVTFEVEAGKQYKVIHEPQKNLEDARAFAEQPEFQVVNAKTKEVIESAVELSRPRTFLTQLKSAVTPVYEFESDQVATGNNEVQSMDTLPQLKALWSQASEQEREAFQQWLLAQ